MAEFMKEGPVVVDLVEERGRGYEVMIRQIVALRDIKDGGYTLRFRRRQRLFPAVSLHIARPPPQLAPARCKA